MGVSLKEVISVPSKDATDTWMYLGFAKYFILRYNIYDIITNGKD
jgi:hypothetical protein